MHFVSIPNFFCAKGVCDPFPPLQENKRETGLTGFPL